MEQARSDPAGRPAPDLRVEPADEPAVEAMTTVARLAGSGDTRAALLDAAEVLFAQHGVEGPSLREINRAAGQRNTTSLQYHFRDRKSLLTEVLARHTDEVASRRHALLDLYVHSGTHDPRALVNVLVLPLLAKLTDSAGGPNFLSIAAELMNRGVRTVRGEPAGLLIYDRLGTMESWSRHIEPFIPPRGLDEPFHRRRLAVRFVYSELGRRARTGDYEDSQLYASHLVDTVLAMLVTPFSQDTLRLLGDR